MSNVYTTIDASGLDEDEVYDQAKADAREFFSQDDVTVELLTWDIVSNLATFRVDRRSGTLLG